MKATREQLTHDNLEAVEMKRYAFFMLFIFFDLLFIGASIMGHSSSSAHSVEPNVDAMQLPQDITINKFNRISNDDTPDTLDNRPAGEWLFHLPLVAGQYTTPLDLELIASYKTLAWVVDVEIQGNYAYIATCAPGGLQVLDISTPETPIWIGTHMWPDCARDLTVVDNYAYVADQAGGLRIVDVSIPSALVETGFYTTTHDAYHVAVADQYAYVLGRDLSILNISNPSHPELVGSYSILGGDAGLSMIVSGHYVYVGATDYYSGQLMVFDTSTPSTPKLLKTYPMPSEIRGLAKAGNYLFAADHIGRMHVFDVSNPGTPIEVGAASDSAIFNGVAVANNYAFSAGSPGVSVFNVGAPRQPSYAGHYPLPAYAWDVTTAGNYVFVADAEGGLFVLRPVGTAR